MRWVGKVMCHMILVLGYEDIGGMARQLAIIAELIDLPLKQPEVGEDIRGGNGRRPGRRGKWMGRWDGSKAIRGDAVKIGGARLAKAKLD